MSDTRMQKINGEGGKINPLLYSIYQYKIKDKTHVFLYQSGVTWAGICVLEHTFTYICFETTLMLRKQDICCEVCLAQHISPTLK